MAAKYKHPANTKAGRHERVEAANKRKIYVTERTEEKWH